MRSSSSGRGKEGGQRDRSHAQRLAARRVSPDRSPGAWNRHGADVGFDNAKVDAAFFPDGRWKSNFLCNLGKGDPAKIFARSPGLRSRRPAGIA
jgi:hypothetical protein